MEEKKLQEFNSQIIFTAQVDLTIFFSFYFRLKYLKFIKSYSY